MFCISLQELVYGCLIYSVFYVMMDILEGPIVIREPSMILRIRNQEEFKKSVENTMETLDENKDAMNEGTYIKMCNNVKNIWECVN